MEDISKLIVILIDGLGFEDMKSSAGYLEHLVEWRVAAKYRVRGELPAMSRPMYETILTGLPVIEHGIVTNGYKRPSNCPNLFSLSKDAGKVNAAAAYSWISELYSSNGPYDPLAHRYQLESNGHIQHGIYYHVDDYPDAYLYYDGDYLRRTYTPDLLFLHPMNCDHMGHIYGSKSKEYRAAAINSADIISSLMEGWRTDGYDVIVTADHGMDELGEHGGNTEVQRDVALYIISDQVEPGDFTGEHISQLQVAPLCCTLMGVKPGPRMQMPNQIRGCGRSQLM